jgi:hypothetical protein
LIDRVILFFARTTDREIFAVRLLFNNYSLIVTEHLVLEPVTFIAAAAAAAVS